MRPPDELLDNVGHCLWTFTLPKMLRPFFMRERELLSSPAQLAYETIKQLTCEAAAAEIYFGKRPRHLDARDPPRARPKEGPTHLPVRFAFLDKERGLPILIRHAA